MLSEGAAAPRNNSYQFAVYWLSDSCDICKLLRGSELDLFFRASGYKVPNWSLTARLAASNSLAADDRPGHVCALGDLGKKTALSHTLI